MRTLVYMGILTGLVVSVGLAADDYAILVYPLPRATVPPVIDGSPADTVWASAPTVSAFTLYDRPVVADVQTAFQAVFDDDFIYFAVVCVEPQPDRISWAKTARDDHSVFSGEAVEIFIDPAHSHADYHQLAVGAGGGIWDSAKSDTSWDSGIRAAAGPVDAGWIAELAVPWADLGVTPTPGTIIGLNVCRDRNAARAREWTNWSQTKANFHDPERFGHLVVSPTPEQLGALAVELRKGGRSGPLRIFGTDGFTGVSYRELAMRSLAAIDTKLAALYRARDSEQDVATRSALTGRIEDWRDQVTPIRESIQTAETLDGLTWAQLDVELHGVSAALEGVIWDARLSALLSGI